MKVYVVLGWPKTGTRENDLDVIGVYESIGAFKTDRDRLDASHVIGWGYLMEVEGRDR